MAEWSPSTQVEDLPKENYQRRKRQSGKDILLDNQQPSLDEFDVFCRMAISPVTSMDYFQSHCVCVNEPDEHGNSHSNSSSSTIEVEASETIKCADVQHSRLSKYNNLSLKLPSPSMARRSIVETGNPQMSSLFPGKQETLGSGINRSRSLRLPSESSRMKASNDSALNDSNSYEESLDKDDEREPKVIRVRSFKRTSKGVVSQGDVVRSCCNRVDPPVLSPCTQTHHASTLPSLIVSEEPVDTTGSSKCTLPSSSSFSNLRVPGNKKARSSSPVSPKGGKYHKERGNSKESLENVSSYRIKLVGASGVGKSTLCKQFTTSEYLGAHTEYDHNEESKDWEFVTIDVDGKESNLYLMVQNGEPTLEDVQTLDGIIVVYAIDDLSSYQFAVKCLQTIRRLQEGHHSVALVLVANKSDLVRGRETSNEEGKHVAQSVHAKYLEISTVLNHRVDDLLVGMVIEIRELAKKSLSSPSSSLIQADESSFKRDVKGSAASESANSSSNSKANATPGFFKQSTSKLGNFFRRAFPKVSDK